MGYLIAGIVLVFLYLRNAGNLAAAAQNCSTGSGSTCQGIATSLDALFSGGTYQNQPEMADAASPQFAGAAPAPPSGSGGSPVETLDLPFSISQPPQAPASAAPTGVTPISAQPVARPKLGFGSAGSRGGNGILLPRITVFDRPGEPGTSTYGKSQVIFRGSQTKPTPPSTRIPVPAHLLETAAAAGHATGAPVHVGQVQGAGPNKGISPPSSDWVSWAPTPHATEMSPWEVSAMHDEHSAPPIATLSTHPGMPRAGAPAFRPGAASTPHVVSSGQSARSVAARPAQSKVAAAQHVATHELSHASAFAAPKLTAATPAHVTPAKPMASVRTRPAPKPPVKSKPLSNFRVSLGYKV